jgi:hypothetical protein
MSAHPRTGAGDRSRWQVALTFLGAALVLAGGVLEFDILHHSSATVVRRLTGKTAGTVTTVSAAAPATSLVATCLGAGIVLLLVGAFFSRITKISIDNVGEIDLATVSKLADKSAQAAADSVPKAAQIFKRAATAVVAERSSRVSRPSAVLAGGGSPPDDATLQAMVDEAAKNV